MKEFKSGRTSSRLELDKSCPLLQTAMISETMDLFQEFLIKVKLNLEFNGFEVNFIYVSGSCSSCYSFAAQGAIEAAIAKKSGKLIQLSPQVIIDCNKNQTTGNWGCNVSRFFFQFRFYHKEFFSRVEQLAEFSFTLLATMARNPSKLIRSEMFNMLASLTRRRLQLILTLTITSSAMKKG